jgi:hypothetical protein
VVRVEEEAPVLHAALGLAPSPGLALGVRFAERDAFGLGVGLIRIAKVGAPLAGVCVDSFVNGGVGEDVVALFPQSTGTGLGARATTVGTGAEAGPVTNGAVFRAGLIFAGLRLLGVRALNTAVGVVSVDGALASLGARAASLSALSPAFPTSVLTIDGAVFGVAFAGHLESAASLATVQFGGGDFASFGLGTATAGDRAARPGRPLVFDTVDRAVVHVAVLIFGKGGALDTTVSSSTILVASTGLTTSAARHGANVPSTPVADLAVDRARMSVTGVVVVEAGAGNTAVLGLDDDSTGTSGSTTVASGVAFAPGAPTTNHTVDSANLGAASADFAEHRADIAFVLSINNDFTRAGFSAVATRHRAATPGAPFTDLAVDRARTIIAGFHLPTFGAVSAAEVESSLYGALAVTLAVGAAAFGAFAPVRPTSHLAVNGAVSELNASGVPAEVTGTSDTTIRRSDGHAPLLGLGTRATAVAAFSIVSPVAHDAVDGARVSVAGLGLAERRAGNTAPLGRRLSASTRLEVD